MITKKLNYGNRRIFGDWQIIYHLAGAITSLSPNFQPRSLQTIVDTFFTKFKTFDRTERVSSMYYVDCSYNELKDILKELLMLIPEFRALNLSTDEYQSGVDPDDPERFDKICFISRYTETNTSNDFIDLDACIGNIVNGLYRELEIFSDSEAT